MNYNSDKEKHWEVQDMIVIWAVTAICAFCSLILLSERGSILIVGYNTMSKEDQE